MTKRSVRRAAWVGVAVCVVVLAFGLTTRLLRPAPGIMEIKSYSVREGMKVREVIALLGTPQRFRVICSASPVVGQWSGPDGTIEVVFVCRGPGGILAASADSVSFVRKEQPKSLLQIARAAFGW